MILISYVYDLQKQVEYAKNRNVLACDLIKFEASELKYLSKFAIFIENVLFEVNYSFVKYALNEHHNLEQTKLILIFQ